MRKGKRRAGDTREYVSTLLAGFWTWTSSKAAGLEQGKRF